MSLRLFFIICIVAICAVASSARADDGETAPSDAQAINGVDPTVFVTRTDLKNIYDRGPNGANVNTTVLRGDYTIKQVFKFRVDVPFVYADRPGSNSRYGLGDVALRLAGLVTKTDHMRFAVGADFFFDTATAQILGNGKYDAAGLVATSFYPSDWFTIVFPFLKYRRSFAGDSSRPDINRFEVETDFQVSLPHGWWTELQSKVQVNFADNNSARWLLEAEVGKMITKHIGVWIHPAVCPAGKRPYDFSIEAGIRYLIKL